MAEAKSIEEKLVSFNVRTLWAIGSAFAVSMFVAGVFYANILSSNEKVLLAIQGLNERNDVQDKKLDALTASERNQPLIDQQQNNFISIHTDQLRRLAAKLGD